MTPPRPNVALALGLGVVVVSLPLWAPEAVGSLLLDFGVVGLIALGWSTAAGRIGVAFLGGHGFAAVGAVITYLCGREGVPPALAAVLAVLVGAAAGAVNALAARRSGPLVAAGATLMVGALLAGVSAEILARAVHPTSVVAGTIGPIDVPLDAVRAAPLGGAGVAAALGLGAAFALCVALHVLSNSRTALVLQGAANRVDYVGGLGLGVGKARALAWGAVGAAFAAAGALDAWGKGVTQISGPADLFRWTAPAMAIAGVAGLGEPVAAVVVALLYTVVDRLFPGQGSAWPAVASAASVVVMIRWPRGLAGLQRRWLPLGSRSVRRFADATRLPGTVHRIDPEDDRGDGDTDGSALGR